MDSGTDYTTSDIIAQRKAIIQDVGNTLSEVRMDYFAALLPPLRRVFDPPATGEKLKDKGQIVHDGWACLKGGLAEADENECGDKPLRVVDIVRAIADASPHVKDKQLLTLRQDPSQAPKANTRSAKHRPDGYLVKAGD